MTEKRNILFRFIAFVIVTLILAGAQTSFWVHVFGSMTPPAFWLIVILYLSLQRENNEGLLTVFFLSFILAVFTSLNDGLLTLTHLAIFFTARFVKSRVFAFSGWYFGAACGLAVPFFSLSHFLLSQPFDSNPPTNIEWLGLLFQIPLTAFFGLVLFPMFLFIDSFFKDEITENWRGTL
ncbi:MAG: hypothetical protein AB7F59_02060 [Bdellovibrionales bacterium]